MPLTFAPNVEPAPPKGGIFFAPQGINHTDMMIKRPTDANQLGKRIVDLATGQATDHQPTRRQLGGVASASKLTAEQRRERARKAAAARWPSV